MALDVTRSLIKNKDKDITQDLRNNLEQIFDEKWLNGKLYLWFPIININSSIFQLDALLVSESIWVIVFSIVNKDVSAVKLDTELEKQKSILRRLHNKFNLDEDLYDLDEWIKISIKAISYSDDSNQIVFNTQYDKKWRFSPKMKRYKFALNKEDLIQEIQNGQGMSPIQYKKVIWRIQDVINLNKKTYRKIDIPWSKWDVLTKIDESISNLDPTQENAVVSFFDWIQRIRWLAWSWKTIILALKVAFYHTLRPEEKIAVTFYSASLKQQFEELINIFCTSKLTRPPNWNNIEIIHARWWSKNEWIYHKLCYKYWKEFLTFNQARNRNTDNQTHFEYVCNVLLNDLEETKIIEEYDIMFIDEAQDLSAWFLKLCYMLLKKDENNNKRLIYAYDELQKLDEWNSLPSPEEIFWVEFTDFKNQDLILKKCYRNSKEVLTTAHALWFWIYRDWWLVQFFKDKSLWSEIWYWFDWSLEAWSQISLFRDSSSSPSYFEEHFKSEEFVEYKVVKSDEEQANYIASSIVKNINEEDLLPSDILVIYPDSRPKPKNVISLIKKELFRNWIKTYFAWWDDPAIFSKQDHVTIAWIHRAKWNERWMVYVINWHSCYPNTDSWIDLKKARNIIFTALTRSKAWVRIVWEWEWMQKICKEIEKLRENDYKLIFESYPTDDQINDLDNVYWNTGEKENKNKMQHYQIIDNIIEDINNWADNLSNYAEDTQLLELIKSRM